MPSGAITLDQVAAVAEHDENHRYELSVAGVLQVTSPPTWEHQEIISRITFWLFRHGYGPERILSTAGTHVGADNASGGRMPDLTVWAPGAAQKQAELANVEKQVTRAASELTDLQQTIAGTAQAATADLAAIRARLARPTDIPAA